MSKYKDLTLYNKFHYERSRNVGFNVRGEEKHIVEINDAFIKKLINYYEYPVNITRVVSTRTLNVDGHKLSTGFSEIRVMSENGDIYAAPDSIISDILSKLYNPPKLFVNAVLNGVDTKSEKYQMYLSRYNPEFLWVH